MFAPNSQPSRYLHLSILVGVLFCVLAVGAFFFLSSGAYRSLLSEISPIEHFGGMKRDDARSIVRISANLSVESLAEAIRVVKAVEPGPICSIMQYAPNPKSEYGDLPWERDTTQLFVTIGKEDREGCSHGLYILKQENKSWKIFKKTYVVT